MSTDEKRPTRPQEPNETQKRANAQHMARVLLPGYRQWLKEREAAKE